jgi:hypothetical protein
MLCLGVERDSCTLGHSHAFLQTLLSCTSNITGLYNRSVSVASTMQGIAASVIHDMPQEA